jgi:hypothetical protein
MPLTRPSAKKWNTLFIPKALYQSPPGALVGLVVTPFADSQAPHHSRENRTDLAAGRSRPDLCCILDSKTLLKRVVSSVTHM